MGFVYYNPNPAGRFVGDCVIRALTVAFNDSWENIYADLTMQGRFMYDMPNLIALLCLRHISRCRSVNHRAESIRKSGSFLEGYL